MHLIRSQEQDKHTHNATEDAEEIPQDRALVDKGPPGPVRNPYANPVQMLIIQFS